MLVLPLAAQPRCAPVPPGLSAWFTFDEPPFRQPGPHQPLHVAGRVGGALQFNGQDQYVEIPTSTPGLDVGEDDFTIELWMRTKDSVHTRSIADKRDWSPLGYLIYVDRGHAGFQIADGDRYESVLVQSINVADNRWHHVACVVKRLPPAPPAVYVDGRGPFQKSTRNVTLRNLDAGVPLWLGRHHPNKDVHARDYFFEGGIDELSVYRRALSAAQIQSIFRAGSSGKCRSK